MNDKAIEFFKNNPLVFEQYNEILKENQSSVVRFENKLQDIKEYAIKHTKFYSKYKIDDVFPVLTKADYLSNYDDFLSDESFAKPSHISLTSGSTGTPFQVKQDFVKRARAIADLKVYGDYAFYNSHDKMLHLRSLIGKQVDREVDKRENIWRYDISKFDENNIDKLIDFILDWKPITIFGYSSILENIANYIIKQNKDYEFGCKSVIVSAETLTDTVAEKIIKVFKCPLFDRYADMEMGTLAQKEFGKTNYKINKSSFYIEVLKLDCDETANEGEIGRLVFTDLHNHAFPLIRYDTGDLGSYCIKDNQIELEQIYGRRVDSIYDTKNNLLCPFDISHSMWGMSNILQWQFIQKGQYLYCLNVNAISKVDEEKLITLLSRVLGDDAVIKIEYVKEIPVLSSQKRKYIVNDWKK